MTVHINVVSGRLTMNIVDGVAEIVLRGQSEFLSNLQVRQLAAGLPLLPLLSGGVCTLTLVRSTGVGGSADEVFLASGNDAQLLAALPELVVDTAALGAELNSRCEPCALVYACLPP